MNKHSKIPEYLDTILCDDIRREVNNKISLIGVYGDKIYVPDFPFLFGHFGLVQLWKGGEGTFKISVQLVDPTDKELVRTPELEMTLTEEQNRRRVILSFAALKVEMGGLYKIVTTLDGKKLTEYPFAIEKAPQGFEFK